VGERRGWETGEEKGETGWSRGEGVREEEAMYIESRLQSFPSQRLDYS
jgi:hypothetical protein